MLIDKKPGPTPRGHAEGLKSTTTEILGSFGLGPQVEAEAWRLEEIAIWGEEQDQACDGGEDGGQRTSGLRRERVIKDRVEELGFGTVRETILQQGEWCFSSGLGLVGSADSNSEGRVPPAAESAGAWQH